MRSIKVLAVAAALSVPAITANAGGLAPAIIPAAPQQIVVTPPAAGGSISPGYIVLGVVAALVAASASF